MIVPKFAYNTGAGIVDFTPTNPAVKKTPQGVGPLVASRHDSITTSGIKQSVFDRIDEFLELSFEDVPETDLASWKAFMSWALTGAQFTYYPDATDLLTYFDYTLENTDWRPKWKSWKNYAFTLNMRLWHGTATYYS